MNNYNELLKKAPKDQWSDDFLQFLRDNNKVIKETESLLIIENCKYHTEEKPHHTAFFKSKFNNSFEIIDIINSLMDDYFDWEWLKRRKEDQTVKRFHIHLIR